MIFGNISVLSSFGLDQLTGSRGLDLIFMTYNSIARQVLRWIAKKIGDDVFMDDLNMNAGGSIVTIDGACIQTCY